MTTDILSTDELMHYGVLRKSGRYPWGSGENSYQRNKTFLAYVDDLKKKGLSETQIAEGLSTDEHKMTTTQLRALKSIAKNQTKASDISEAYRLKEKGWSNVAIGERMGIPDTSVGNLLKPETREKNDLLVTTSNMLKDQLKEKPYLDIGAGVENHLGISDTKLSTAVSMLQEEGYTVHKIKVPQQFGKGDTTVKVLAPPDTTWADVIKNQEGIKTISEISDDGGRSWLGLQDPMQFDSKRLGINYAEDGGTAADGVIYVRPGVDDVSLGGKRYAQVRIAVDGTHYIKGMAVYRDDLPDGVDLVFNTNKANKGNKLDVLKPLKEDPETGTIDKDNPFGSALKHQILDVDANGKTRVTSVMNIVNEEGDWNEWSKTLSSQVLSKQPNTLAKQQLDLALKSKQDEFAEILSLTNPVVKQHMLEKFADGADSSSVDLKAAALPRQRSQVILPVNEMKETEVFAPNYRDGEKVVLIRYPHGGKFEIPELTVNNRQADAKKMLGGAKDAIGINAKVAERLSGADFDGDTVLVIPNNSRSIKTESPLEGLKGFDPQSSYPRYEGMPLMSARAKQQQMGDVSNLITDMTIRGASNAELARAVKHSMVVIDAEKHKLNYKQSATDQRIKELKAKYQVRPDGTAGGSSTIISRASSEIRVNERIARRARDGGPFDPATGKRMYTETGASYINKAGKEVVKTTRTTKMAEATDALSLSSGTPMEAIYANHANQLKAMANTARKEAYRVKPQKYDSVAKARFATEVATLNAKLNTALKFKPLERQAQLIANTVVDAKRKANPHLEADGIKKIKSQALAEARYRTGAHERTRIGITESEWAAIQAGAISTSKQRSILQNTDLDDLKSLATPRAKQGISPAKLARARSMSASGYTQAEIADALGVSTSTINAEL